MELNEIYNTCKKVMENSKYVKIRYDKLDEFIKNVKYDNLKHWLSYNQYGIMNIQIDKLINLLLLFESIDYSFWRKSKMDYKN